MAFLREFILMEGQKEKEKERKERERKGRRVKGSTSSYTLLHRTVGRSASLGITSRRAVKEDVKESMHAGSVWIPLTPLSCIPQEMPAAAS